MLETKIQNNSALISLSRAAQITGYHQDYLGQLCRLGKLSSIKVGRNWFTFPEAITKLAPSSLNESGMQEQSMQQVDMSVEEVLKEMAQEANNEQQTGSASEHITPKIIHNVTISQVEGMPISIRTIPAPASNMNNVQNILTTLRIESLQREVYELRQLLTRLMSEVANHSTILNARAQNKHVDSLKHSYVSNFDFNSPYSSKNLLEEDDMEQSSVEQIPQLNWQPPRPEPRYSIIAIMSGAAVMVAIALMTYGIVSGQFFGDVNPQVSTIYYQSPVIAQELDTTLQPTVAGQASNEESVGNTQ